jgi:tricorn protease
VFDKRTGIYALALQPDNRFPFKPDDELSKPGDKPAEGATEQAAEKAAEKAVAKAAPKAAAKGLPAIVYAGLAERLYEVPLAAGNYRADGRQAPVLPRRRRQRRQGQPENAGDCQQRPQPEVFVAGVREFDLSRTASTSTTAPSPPARATCWWWRRAPKRRPTSQGQGQGG